MIKTVDRKDKAGNNTRSDKVVPGEVFAIWSGTDASLAPHDDVPMGHIGFSDNASQTAKVWIYDLNNDNWVDTGQTLPGFFNV